VVNDMTLGQSIGYYRSQIIKKFVLNSLTKMKLPQTHGICLKIW